MGSEMHWEMAWVRDCAIVTLSELFERLISRLPILVPVG